MEKVKLSIVVPCYKVEKYLPRCLDSLLNQTLKEIEIICINDGSPDNCLNILTNYKKENEKKLIIIDKENEGVWKARKSGIEAARGEYIGFVDPDDYVALDYAEKLYDKAVKEEADISVCGFDRVDMLTGKLYSREMCESSNKIISINENPGALLELNTALWNKIYRSSVIKNFTDIKNTPTILEDMMFLLLIYLNANTIVFLNESLIYYQVRKDSTINTIKKEQIESTYNALLEVRDVYIKHTVNEEMLEMLDAMAFLHLGVSLMFRLSYDKSCDLSSAIRTNNQYMDDHFPSWKDNQYINLKYVLTHHYTNLKLWIVKIFYKFHLFRLFLSMYKFMIDRLKIDIKW